MAKRAPATTHKTPQSIALHGPLSEATITRISNSIGKKFRAGELPRPKSVFVEYPYGRIITLAIPKSHGKIIGSGTQHIVIDAGVHETEHGKLRFVLKVPLFRALEEPLNKKQLANLHVINPVTTGPARMEVATKVLRDEGLPVGFVHAIPFGPSSSALLMERNPKGTKIREVSDVDFTRLKNGKGLNRQLDKWIDRIGELREQGRISSQEHGGNLEERAIAEHAFGVLIHKDAKGDLVGDAVVTDPHYAVMPAAHAKDPSVTELQKKVHKRVGIPDEGIILKMPVSVIPRR